MWKEELLVPYVDITLAKVEPPTDTAGPVLLIILKSPVPLPLPILVVPLTTNESVIVAPVTSIPVDVVASLMLLL